MAVVWVGMLGRSGAARVGALAIGAVLILAITAVAAATGVLSRFDVTPPPMAMLILSVLALSLVIGLGPIGRGAAGAVPLMTLVGVQAFRLPLELLMHHAAEVGVMPREMSYSGYNFDIVTGAGALALFAAARLGLSVPRALIWIWNLWGFACLGIILVVAVLSSPMVRFFGDDPRHLNTWVLFFPYVWLPAVLVTIAMSGHIVVTRALLQKDRPAAV